MSFPEVPTLEQLNQQLFSWSEVLKKPLWYKEVMPVLLKYWQQLPKNEQTKILKDRLYQFFTEKLEEGQLALAKSGPNFDFGRSKFPDTAVIHYTGNKPGISWQLLSTIGFLRQYASDYLLHNDVWGIPTKDQPIWSGHFREGKMVFYAYHWLVRLDGQVERLLDDHYVGWHAGKRDVNQRSVAIVLDGEFLDTVPSEAAILSITKILNEYYPQIKPEHVFGHLEVNPETECPGKLFLPVWKNKILEGLKQ